MGYQIQTVQGDITKVDDLEAIVNAANNSLLGGGGVDGAIHRAGEAKLTKAYLLPCKYVIHTVGPIWHGGDALDEQLLENVYRNSLKVAVEHGIRTIAFPSISTGVYRYPVEQAALVAARTVQKFCEEHMDKIDIVRFVLFDPRTLAAYAHAVCEIKT